MQRRNAAGCPLEAADGRCRGRRLQSHSWVITVRSCLAALLMRCIDSSAVRTREPTLGVSLQGQAEEHAGRLLRAGCGA